MRLALAGQTEYQFNGNVIDEVETTPEGMLLYVCLCIFPSFRVNNKS